MTSRYLSGRTAILVAALCSLANSSACDVPTEVTPSAETVDADAEFDRGEPDLNQLYIEEIASNGKGCPKNDPNTVATTISADKKSFVIIYRDMQLDNPPGPNVKNLSCQAAVKLHIPGGYQVALATVNTRGYAYLDQGIQARETSSYFFAGIPLGAHPHTMMVGPYDGFYEFSDTVPLESLVWSACGTSALFGINTTLNLNAKANPNGQAIFSTDTIDGIFRTELLWQIRSC
jgi:hypothetical protein